MDEIAREFGRRLDKMCLDAMTSNVPTEPQRGLCMADLQFGLIVAGNPRPNVGKIIESIHMTDRVEDWSRVRSPSRTLRRMRYNAHRVYTYKPKQEAMMLPDGSMVMHPAVAARVRNAIKTS